MKNIILGIIILGFILFLGLQFKSQKSANVVAGQETTDEQKAWRAYCDEQQKKMQIISYVSCERVNRPGSKYATFDLIFHGAIFASSSPHEINKSVNKFINK